MDEADSLDETVAILSDPDTFDRLAASEAELVRGEGESEEQLRRAMRRRRQMGA